MQHMRHVGGMPNVFAGSALGLGTAGVHHANCRMIRLWCRRRQAGRQAPDRQWTRRECTESMLDTWWVMAVWQFHRTNQVPFNGTWLVRGVVRHNRGLRQRTCVVRPPMAGLRPAMTHWQAVMGATAQVPAWRHWVSSIADSKSKPAACRCGRTGRS